MSDSKSMFYREAQYYKYLLKKDFTIHIPLILDEAINQDEYVQLIGGKLNIISSYAWDGSSVPGKKYIKWIWDCDKYCKIASLVHDALCQLIRKELLSIKYKQAVDEIYRELCIKGGMSIWLANIRYKGLRMFGDGFVKPNPKTDKGKVIEVPLRDIQGLIVNIQIL